MQIAMNFMTIFRVFANIEKAEGADLKRVGVTEWKTAAK